VGTLIAGILVATIVPLMAQLDVYQQDPAAMSLFAWRFFDFRWLCWVTAEFSSARRDLPVVHERCRSSSVDVGIRDRQDGCQVSGDGDWGIIVNQALKPEWLPTWLWAQEPTTEIYWASRLRHPGVYPTPLYETAARSCVSACVGGRGVGGSVVHSPVPDLTGF